jgi:hypothetical protein|tara:strand:+ start:127 stop:291 length:165 start_codon:yes stop_codon:yes gene_type:complete
MNFDELAELLERLKPPVPLAAKQDHVQKVQMTYETSTYGDGMNGVETINTMMSY